MRRAVAALPLLAVAACASVPDSPTFSDCAACPEMVVIPAGMFVMGSTEGEEGRSEGPVREVAIARPFAMGIHEVTHGEFRRYVEATGKTPAASCRVFADGSWGNRAGYDWRNPGPGVPTGDDLPVVCVSWRDAAGYAAWLSAETGEPYRLPSEAEWEYAARAGAPTRYAWGETEDGACAQANLYDLSARSFGFAWEASNCDDGSPSLAPVGTYAANAFGLHDMLGNVWEWTADCYVVPYAPRDDVQAAYEVDGECARRTVRGGSWITRASRLRPAFRGRDPEDARMNYFGFRLARDLD